MQMNDLKAIIDQGEGVALEFKASRTALNRDVYETVCAFLNRHGGTLLLGVNDEGEVSGVDKRCVAQMKKDFVNAINNPQKINPPAYLSITEEQIDGQTVLRIYVPESSQVHRCSGRIYDRNEDGDFDITDHTRLVAEMYHRKQSCYTENKIYPYAGLNDLETELILKCRKIAVLRREDHPWGDMDDMELLKSAQLYQTDPETGERGVTLAGLLLLGKRAPLLSAVPHHRTDLILRKVNLDRYDDRDFVTANLVESYDRIMAFVRKHLPDPFYLEGDMSVSIRDTIFREVASNLLIHREYTNAFPAKLIIERGQVRTENSNKPHGFGPLNPANFTPFPKNPILANFFQQIGRADELGSGMRKMMKYGKAFGGADPELIEGDVFRMIINVPEQSTSNNGVHDGVHDGVYDGVYDDLNDLEMRVLRACIDDSRGSAELLEQLGFTARSRNFRKAMVRLVDGLCLLERTLPDKPKSKNQKYRLTSKGRQVLARMDDDGKEIESSKAVADRKIADRQSKMA